MKNSKLSKLAAPANGNQPSAAKTVIPDQTNGDVTSWGDQPQEAYEDQSFNQIAEKVEETIRLVDRDRLEVGIFLRDTLFHNDQTKFRSRVPKESSLRRLSEVLEKRQKVSLPPSTLHQLVAVAFQEDCLDLSNEEKGRLTYTHRVRLLVVKDPEEKNRFAKTAASERWTTDDLAQAIKRKINGGKAAPQVTFDSIFSVMKRLDQLIDAFDAKADKWPVVVAGLEGLLDKASEKAAANAVGAADDESNVSERSDTWPDRSDATMETTNA